jgi:hypothetical protein
MKQIALIGRKPILAFEFVKPMDMDTRDAKVFAKLVQTWTAEHANVAREFREAREAARKRYGRT